MGSSNVFLVLLSLLYFINVSESIATYSIDFSSEFIKVAIVKPGVPMEIALNKESQRKSPAVVYIRNDERLFDNAAINMGIKFPKNMYHSLTRLIAKELEHPDVKQFQLDYPYYEMFMTSAGQLAFQHDKETVYTAEELLAMVLQHAKEIADGFAELSIKSGVLVVPPFFGQQERAAIKRVVAIAGLNIAQLMNSNAAVALNYGVFRRKVFNSSTQYYMFYDVGSASTIVTLAGYQVVKVKEYGMMAENPQMTVYGIGYNKNLGANEFIIRVQKYLAGVFNNLKKTKDVRSVPRSMAKLLKEATRVVKVLSANTDTYAQVENVLDEVDLRTKINRFQFEQMCEDLFLQFREPLIQALESAQVPLAVVKEVILMGGGTRIPRIQDVILKTSEKTELGKSINTDEAAALGAVYQAAYISPGFKVKNFIVKDANQIPIHVEFYRSKMQDSQEITQHTSRALFNTMSSYPQKKVLTFNKHIKNFSFNVTINEKDMPKIKLLTAKVENLTQVHTEFMKSSEVYTTEFKGVKAHFAIDNSGIFSLNYIEALFERTWLKNKEETTFEKIGNTISNLFGSASDEAAPDANKKDEMENKTEKSSSSSNSSEKINATKNENGSPANETKKPQVELIHENLRHSVVWDKDTLFSQDTVEKSRKLLATMSAADEARIALEKARNELEAYIFQVRSLIESEDAYSSCSTEVERSAVLEQTTKLADWYDEEAAVVTDSGEFTSRRRSLADMMRDIDYRVSEMKARPALLDSLRTTLNTSGIFMTNLKNVTGDNSQSIYTPAEYDSLVKLITDTEKWLNTSNVTLVSMKLYENPTVTSQDIEGHIRALEREMAYLFNKLNIWRNQAAYQQQQQQQTNDTKTGTNDTSSAKDETIKPEATQEVPKTPESDSKEDGESTKTETTTEDTKSTKNGHMDL